MFPCSALKFELNRRVLDDSTSEQRISDLPYLVLRQEVWLVADTQHMQQHSAQNFQLSHNQIALGTSAHSQCAVVLVWVTEAESSVAVVRTLHV